MKKYLNILKHLNLDRILQTELRSETEYQL